MGWGTGTNAQGRDVGYMVDAVCDADGCDKQINRGLAYVCGGMHDGGEYGCGNYFCDQHLLFSNCPDSAMLCQACSEQFPYDDEAEGGATS